MLLEAGAEINALDNSKMTPLQRASQTGNLGSHGCSLDWKADFNAVDNYAYTPIQVAVEENNEARPSLC